MITCTIQNKMRVNQKKTVHGGEKKVIKCDKCPRSKDLYPEKVDLDGYHYHICGMGGNIVYPTPHKVKRVKGSGYIKFGISSCGLYDTIEEVLNDMTEPEVRRWQERTGNE